MIDVDVATGFGRDFPDSIAIVVALNQEVGGKAIVLNAAREVHATST